jgi:hypothetical protein
MNKFALAAAFSNVNGASFVGIDTMTTVALRGGKSNEQQGRVTKRMTGAQVMVFSNQKTNGYEAMIQRRLEAEGKDPASFSVGPRAWGTRIPDMPIVEHTGKDGVTKYYLEVIFLRPGRVEYFLDGLSTHKAAIQGLDEKDPGEQGGLENKVVIRTFAAESITAVRVDAKVFV